MGCTGESWGFFCWRGLGENLLTGTNESEVLRLTLKGIRVRISPGLRSPGARASCEAGLEGSLGVGLRHR